MMNTIVITIVIFGIMSSIIVALEIIHFIERRDLYDRIMSRDISDYKRAVDKSPTEKRESPHRRAIQDFWERGERMKNSGRQG